MKDLTISIQKVSTDFREDELKPIPKHIIKKLQRPKTKRILKAARENLLSTHKRSSMRFLVDFSSETVEARRQ